MTRVLVAGATGQQGGEVARQLIARGHQVSALVRDPESPAAQMLRTQGARLVAGDLRNADTLTSAVKGHEAVFGLSIPSGGADWIDEVRAGRALVDAAADAHLVYSSVRGGNRVAESGVGHADAKQLVEAHLRERATSATVIGPVYFMDNARNTSFSGLRRGVLSTPLTPNKRLDQVAVADIAGMAVHAIEHPDELIGRRIDIASDSLTGAEAAAILSRVTGHELPYEQLPIELVRRYSGEEFASMWESFERNEDFLDIDALHSDYPDVLWHSYEDWASTVDWERILTEEESR